MFCFVPLAQNGSTSHVKANGTSRFRCEVEKIPTFAFESNAYTFLTYKYNTSPQISKIYSVDNSHSSSIFLKHRSERLNFQKDNYSLGLIFCGCNSRHIRKRARGVLTVHRVPFFEVQRRSTPQI